MQRILLASHDPSMKEILCLLLQNNNFTEVVVDQVERGEEAFLKMTENSYDFLIFDLLIHQTDILGFIGKARNLRPKINILTYSFKLEYAFVKRYLTAGINAYCFLKPNEYEEIIKAIRHVQLGKLYISPDMQEMIVNDALFHKKANRFDLLNEREFDVLNQLIKGETLVVMAGIFDVHTTTINLYKSRILDKLRVTSLFELRNMVKLESAF